MGIFRDGKKHIQGIENLVDDVYKHNRKGIDGNVSAIKEHARDMTPKGMSKHGMKVASIPEPIYDMLIQRYGRMCLQDPKFLVWFLKKFPHLRYNPSVRF